MAQIIIRKIEDAVKVRLRRRAQRHGRSMEEEAREILRAATKAEASLRSGLGTRIAARFAGIGLDIDIPEQRGGRPRPARFRL